MTSQRIDLSGPISPPEETLRLIASLPAPDGLVDRVHESLRTAPRGGGVLQWPLWFGPGGFRYSSAMRGMAAAAIVILVAGGGWSIYSHVQPLPAAPTAVQPARISNGFSSADAVRKPDSPNGTVLTHAIVTPAPAVAPKQSANAGAIPKHSRKHKAAAIPAPQQR